MSPGGQTKRYGHGPEKRRPPGSGSDKKKKGARGRDGSTFPPLLNRKIKIHMIVRQGIRAQKKKREAPKTEAAEKEKEKKESHPF